MIKIAFQGLIHSGDLKAVSNLMEEWLQTEKLKLKVKVNGDAIVYEDENIYFYCHSAMAGPLFLLVRKPVRDTRAGQGVVAALATTVQGAKDCLPFRLCAGQRGRGRNQRAIPCEIAATPKVPDSGKQGP